MNLPRQSGFSLVELMIGMTLGLVLIGATIVVFLQSRSTARQTQFRMGIQDNARYAMQMIVNDLSMAGFLGGPQASDVDTSNTSLGAFPATNHCGPGAGPAAVTNWTFALDTAIEFMDKPTEAQVHAAFGCTTAHAVVGGSDVFAIRRVRGTPAADYDGSLLGGLSANSLYVRANNVVGSLMYLADPSLAPLTGGNPSAPPFSYSALIARVYFLRTYAETAGDGIPTLCRANLVTNNYQIECLAEGIEEMDFQFGLDTDADLVPDHYTATPSATELTQALTVRIRLLVRSADADGGYTNSKTYQINGRSFVPNDSYYRRMFDRTVILHNPAIRQGLVPT